MKEPMDEGSELVSEEGSERGRKKASKERSNGG